MQSNVTYHTNHAQGRLYIETIRAAKERKPQDLENCGSESLIKEKAFGIREYGKIVGFFLTLIGIAFKAVDEKNNTLYINKKSFFKWIDRTGKSYKKFKEIGISAINKFVLDEAYNKKEIDLNQLALNRNELDKLLSQNCMKIYDIRDRIYLTNYRIIIS